ncbi:unnamed protein product [Fraxinus pennsylvanica]|uniref:Oberon-like PHD finger domain-containing protein n=1 Tax=Fraxinus pennsylvanica TaxID=56036 RepID=A0AAD1Z1P2_9LAMI|nr:unnamed protein product [Fraxinus pennsylvanica]
MEKKSLLVLILGIGAIFRNTKLCNSQKFDIFSDLSTRESMDIDNDIELFTPPRETAERSVNLASAGIAVVFFVVRLSKWPLEAIVTLDMKLKLTAIAHIECALRAYMAGTFGGSIGLEIEYYCRRCDSRTDLILHVERLLQTCKLVNSLNVGICVKQEKAVEAYDIAAIKFRGLNVVTNFEISRYDVKSILESSILPIGG